MIVQTLIHCSPAASKTEEILARYRPIAPKPELPSAVEENSPQKPSQSPYIRNIWAHLQARPARARKRGRGAPPSPIQRNKKSTQTRPPLMVVCYPDLVALEEKPTTLSLLSSIEPSLVKPCQALEPALDEKDLTLQLKSPNPWKLVAPKPIRPIRSTIRVGPISPAQNQTPAQPNRKPAEEVENEVEADELPAVISDANNKVRMANSAYKELVGQPECPWLDTLAGRRRISGDVELHVAPGSEVPVSGNGFSCWAKIQWGNNSVDALCDVMKLHCDTKYYLFSWRFHAAKQPSF